MLASYRSQSGEHFLPSSLSLSPCLKNSSHSLSVHSVWWSQGLPGWEMSAIWTKKLNSLDRSGPSSWVDLYMTKWSHQSHDYHISLVGVAYASWPDRISFSCFIWSKWVDMSVASTTSTIVLRTWAYCSELKPLRISESSCQKRGMGGGGREEGEGEESIQNAHYWSWCFYSRLWWSWKWNRDDDFPELTGHYTTWHTLICKDICQ